MSGLVPSTGTAALAAVIASHVGGQVGAGKPQLELGTMVYLGGDALALQPDSWTAEPFENFLRLRPFDLGLLETTGTTVADHGEHIHPIKDPVQALMPGDRVLLCWVAGSPLIIGVVA